MEHPHVSPDLALSDFWLFPEIVCLKGAKISEYSINLRNVTTALKSIPEQEFQKYFHH
jgi:hypothetical protein